MARTALAVTPVTVAGVAVSGAAPDASNGNTVPNNGRTMLSVKNADSSSHTVTIKAYPKGVTPGGLTVTDKVVTVVNGTTMLIGPFPPSIYNDINNLIWLDWSSITSMTVQAFTFAADPS